MERSRSVTPAAAPAQAAATRPQTRNQTRFFPAGPAPAPAATAPTDSDDDMSDDASGRRPHWSRFIQNESYVPPPTPYSPRAVCDEDPLVEQERHCREKLQALRAARDRFRFFPSTDSRRNLAGLTALPLRFSTEMVFSAAEVVWAREEHDAEAVEAPAPSQAGVDALGGLEMLLFEFFTSGELLVAGQTCRRWHRLARLDLLWEPRLVTPFEKYPMRELMGLGQQVPAIQVYMIFRRLKLAQSPFVGETVVSAGAAGGWPLPRRVGERRRALMTLLRNRGNDRDERLQRLLEMELRVRNQDGDGAPAAPAPEAGVGSEEQQLQQPPTLTLQAAIGSVGQDASSILSSIIGMGGQDLLDFDPTASVHLVTPQRTSAAALAGDITSSAQVAAPPPAAEAPDRILQNRFAGLLAAANNRNVDVRNRPQLNARHVGGAASAEEEDVFSVVDGGDRVNLASWLATKKTVSEFALRSFVRQMLLAVRALKAARVEHIDISMANIVVVLGSVSPCSGESDLSIGGHHQQDAEEKATTEEAMEGVTSSAPTNPLFQLFYNRRSLRAVTSNPSEPALDFAVPRPLGVDADLDRDVMQDVDMLEPRGEEGAPVDAAAAALAVATAAIPHDLGVGGAGVARGGLGLFHRATASFSMIQSVLNCAIAVWAHGRFTDSNTIALLTLLLRHPTEFPRGLRSFLEYAKFLLMTNAMSVDRLLQHEFVVSAGESASQSSNIVRYTDWEAGSFRDVVEYRTRVLAWYRSSTNVGMVDVSSSEAAMDILADELTPRTALGRQFFTQALEETGLSTERFVSIVAPADVSSSWIRALALTQTATLQRLDLSRVHVPPSVILKELAKLPRISHLRLPPQFLRDENLEHLIAALEYSALLPALRATDDAVRVAMDRLERSYTMQLDMVTFLLEKPAGR